jgi:mono/diheme cytochrome c family protein
LAVALLLAAPAFAAQPPALYTGAQAKAGASLFAANCAMCHGAELKGGGAPGLIGQSFAPASAGFTIGSVFSVIAQQMPATSPGSLTQDQYAQVMAYILRENGYPAGNNALGYTASLTSTVPLVSEAP